MFKWRFVTNSLNENDDENDDDDDDSVVQCYQRIPVTFTT